MVEETNEASSFISRFTDLICPEYHLVLEIICSGCGTSLYSGIDLKSARDVLKIRGSRCKHCGVLLSPQDFVLEVKAIPT
jgi:hypothetical protein